MLYQYILSQITLTLHFHSGTITLATLTRLIPMLVRRFAGRILPLCSLLDCQAANARLATSKLPQPSVNLLDVAASPSILHSCVCTSCRETCTLVLAVLVRDSWSHIAIQKAGDQGDSTHQVLGLGHVVHVAVHPLGAGGS